VAQARRALADGRVRLETGDGAPVPERDPAQLVFASDVVTLDGARVEPRLRHHYVMLHKPAGVTSTTTSPERDRDLSEFISEMPSGVFPVGRLDRETTGLLLFTTDGDLTTSILRPDHETDKMYWLWIDERIDDHDPRLEALTRGVRLPVGVARASEVRVVGRSEAFTELHLTLHSGMNRQIRRMCYEVGLRLVHLHRLRVGSLHLGDLVVGAWRTLTAEEVAGLWQAVGGHEHVVQRRIAALEREATVARARGMPRLRLEAWLAAI
jgi:pseudouridine synthase